jgi:formate hydrogenlyase transcriptional activator
MDAAQIQTKPNDVYAILIVEDDLAIATALQEKLTKANYKVLVARDGQEGLLQAMATHPDLILLDIIMPEMDGITMLKQLRQDEWGKQAKVIILSNLSEGKDNITDIEKLAAEYLIKTEWDLEDLLVKVHHTVTAPPVTPP